MKQKILDVIAEVNKDIILYNGDNLFDAGILDSLQVVNLIAELEDALDIDIDAAYVVEDNFKTKEAIIAMIEMIIENSVTSCIIRPALSRRLLISAKSFSPSLFDTSICLNLSRVVASGTCCSWESMSLKERIA